MPLAVFGVIVHVYVLLHRRSAYLAWALGLALPRGGVSDRRCSSGRDDVWENDWGTKDVIIWAELLYLLACEIVRTHFYFQNRYTYNIISSLHAPCLAWQSGLDFERRYRFPISLLSSSNWIEAVEIPHVCHICPKSRAVTAFKVPTDVAQLSVALFPLN